MPGYDNTAEWAYRYASIPICYLPKFQFLMICSISSFISFVMLFCVLGWKARNLLAALWNLSGCKKEGFECAEGAIEMVNLSRELEK